ncbi:MAG: ABC transporter ATP-binding protein [Clostridiales bacterium]|nr:ABC transporter ATP-binding protein [Clostridiales bacterium]
MSKKKSGTAIKKYNKAVHKEALKKWNKEKDSRNHGVFNNMKYVLGVAWKNNKPVFFAFFLSALMSSLEQILSPFFNRYIVELALGEQNRIRLIIICISIQLGITIAFSIKRNSESYINNCGQYSLNQIFMRKLIIKQMNTDYENLEKTYLNDTYSKAESGASYISSQAIDVMSRSVSSILQMAAFGGILAILSPLLILIVGVPTVLCYYISRRKMKWVWNCYTPAVVPEERKLNYIVNESNELHRAKDIRMFNMQRWFKKKFDQVYETRMDLAGQRDSWENKMDIFSLIVSHVGDFGAYIYTIFLVSSGNIGAGEFVMYFNSIMHFSNSVKLWLDNFSAYQWLSNNIGFSREYLEIEEKTNRGVGAKIPTKDCEIEFKNVSFTYSGADKPTIKNISFKLNKNEKLAIVGLNGAGKTTLIKLMCGLYDASEGEILLNEKPVNDYNRDEYFDIFSAVFQDVAVLPVTIAQNITQSKDSNYDKEKIYSVLKSAGLYNKVMSLSQKEQTKLVKNVFDNATEFSGGENQKLALAKALYKNSPVLLLDEPTAALDPIAEQEMYMQYAKFTKGKSSIFISHRLASTRFCDKILLIENGEISECGTHQKLMENGKTYAMLFELQSSYYKDGVKNCESKK